MARRIDAWVAAGFLACAAPAGAHVYLTVDENGGLHFSDVRESAAQTLFLADPPAESTARAAAPADGAPVHGLIESAARRNGLDAALLHAVIAVESGYRVRAVSPRGAMGLMQLMPATARELGVADGYEPRANIDAGALHLRRLLDRFGDARLALAAYNAGAGAVERHGNAVPPYPETIEFVRRVEARWQRAGTPRDAGTP